MRRDSIAVLVAIAACALAALLPATASAQGNSAVDQYVEQVPSAGGNKPADKPGAGQGGRPGSGGSDSSGSGGSSSGGSGSGDSNGSDGSGSGSGSGGSDGKSGDKNDGKSDKDDPTASALGGDDGDSGGGGDDAAGELAKASVPSAAGTDDGSGFPLVAFLVIAAIGGAAFLAWWRFAARRGG